MSTEETFKLALSKCGDFYVKLYKVNLVASEKTDFEGNSIEDEVDNRIKEQPKS